MTRKPDRITAMQQIIDAVQAEFPLYQDDTFKCGPDNTCIGCPKKLMELVDTELNYWQHQLNQRLPPGFDEIHRFGKLCKNVRRSLVRNGRITT
ncbi:hypothetical protein [Photobacterium atrarenae]|uniref:Oxidoreductase-like domain-containing protein n=1 Tax=Photobacterium atrarenae TaxID=865757 RepID=A0ABY5GN89_9GAMM|nr:hypothetical protein [Photobacterium atrarenae]UTV30799.1 hypothetical protein NNL38_19775 [Photobacterium atrarenae]